MDKKIIEEKKSKYSCRLIDPTEYKLSELKFAFKDTFKDMLKIMEDMIEENY